MKQKAVIFDIDLTLSDGRHRHHLINDWETFVDLSIHDPVFSVSHNLLNTYKQLGYQIILLTARDKSDYDRTLLWLANNNIHYDALFMKEIGDNRPDCESKEELYRKEIEPYYDVEFVLDDKAENCNFFRTIGITALMFCYPDNKKKEIC